MLVVILQAYAELAAGANAFGDSEGEQSRLLPYFTARRYLRLGELCLVQ